MTEEQFSDPIWRLHNLYALKSAATGKATPFIPRPEQSRVFDEILVRGLRRVIILKSRRLGMSTGIDIMLMDQAIWNAGLQISIVDQTKDDAAKKLQTICKVAFESLPDDLKERFEILRTNDEAFEIRAGGDDISAIYAGKNARGGTNQWLHLSEWGVIQADDPTRSEEILTGAIPSAEHGTIIVETTWKGGKGGHLWDIVKHALETQDKTKDDWHVFFFPWWTDPTATSEGGLIEPETAQYLDELEVIIGRKLTPGQRSWYARRRRENGAFVYREFPSTLEECFRAPIEGAIHAEYIDALRVRGAIRPSAADRSALVHTFWDLGAPMNTVTWYAQFVGPEIRIIDIDLNLDLTPVERVARILAKGYPLGSHYLPHDAQATDKSGRTFAAELTGAGLANVKIIPRTHDIWIGINRLRQLFPRMTFRVPECNDGLAALEAYHTKTDSNGAVISETPVHDWASHPSDALRMLAEAEMAGMISGDSVTARQSRIPHGKPRVLTGFRG